MAKKQKIDRTDARKKKITTSICKSEKRVAEGFFLSYINVSLNLGRMAKASDALRNRRN